MVLILLFVWMGTVNDFCYVPNLYPISWTLIMKLNPSLFCNLFDTLYKYMIQCICRKSKQKHYLLYCQYCSSFKLDSINISHPLVMFTKSVMRRIRIINLLKQSHMSLLIIETQFTIYSTLIIAQPRRCVPLFTYISSRWMVFTKRSDVCRQFRLLRYYIDVHISH